MKFTTSAVVLAALAVGEAAAASIHNHAPKHNHAMRHAAMIKDQVEKREPAPVKRELLSGLVTDALRNMGVKTLASNPIAKNAHSWVGTDGTWTNEFINQSGEDITLVIWGPAGSWVNAIVPQVTVPIPSNGSTTISFADGASGAWAPIYKSSKLVNGQISDTWGEFTFKAPYSVVDVSREVNMNGRNMKIVGPQCVSDMNTCVFVCSDGSNTCLDKYKLNNCATGSQPGANHGTYAGADSGGCGGMGTTANLKTYLG